MAYVTDKMGLRVWDQLNDPYDHDQLADNWNKIAWHDHTPGRGVPIPTEGIADGAITTAKLDPSATVSLADNSVTSAKIVDGTVTDVDIDPALLTKIGVTSGSIKRRGKSIITGTDTRTNPALGLMSTPDVIPGIVLPTDGLLFIAFQGVWNESVVGAANAAIFIGSNQLKGARWSQTAPVIHNCTIGGGTTASTDVPIATTANGLASVDGFGAAAAYTGDVTTGQMIGGGLPSTHPSGNDYGYVTAFANAGTYDISIQFSASSGNVVVKNRKFWAWTWGP